MKLLSPDTGWVVANGGKLYWTKDGGSEWADITPFPPGVVRASVTLGSVFFRPTSEGWAVVSYPEKSVIQEKPSVTTLADMMRPSKTLYAIAHTLNGGDSWSFAPLTYPALPQWIQDTFARPVDMYFLDSRHGWMVIGFESMSRPGKLLATEDGGRSWKWVASPPHSGPITFLSLQDGWLLSEEGADQLYVAHDGCKSWQEVSLTPPPEVGAAIYPTFQAAPVFQNQRKGFLVVHYSGGPGIPTKLVIYSTIDSGKTWQPVKVLAEGGGEHTQAADFPFSIVDSSIIVSTGSSSEGVALASIPLLDGRSSSVRPSDRGVFSLTFADSNNGWAQSTKSGLLATHDGGSTWKAMRLRK